MIDPFRIPTDEEIADAERKLSFAFPSAYKEFLKGGGNVANAKFEAAVVLPGSSYLDLFEIAQTAWSKFGVPKNWLPFVCDNSDYYCITEVGEVRFWSHDGPTDEKWSNFSAWFQQVCVELQ